MRNIILVISVLILLSSVSCSPYDVGPSFEPSKDPGRWDFGEKLMMGARFTASPVLIDDKIVAPSLDGKVYVFDKDMGKKYFLPESGRELFFNEKGKRVYINAAGKEVEPLDYMYRITQGIRSTPAHRNGILYFGAFDLKIHGVDLETGQDRFIYETENYISASPLIVDDVIYIGGYDMIFRAIDLTESQQKWQFKTEGQIRGGAVSTSNGVVFGNEAGTLYHLSRVNGEVIWKIETEHETYGTPAYIDELIICADLGGTVKAINENDGSIYWEYKTEPNGFPYEEEFWGNPAVDENGVYIGSTWGKFYALKLHPESGSAELIWEPFLTHSESGFSDYILSDATLVKETLVTEEFPEGYEDFKILFGCNDGKMYCIDGLTGQEKWVYETLGEIRSQPLVYEGKVVFPSNDHYFYGLELETGQPVRGTHNAG